MKILLDECIDWRLMRDLGNHEVKSVRQMGWLEFKNGDLLAIAQRHFDAFITVDRNLKYQNYIPELDIAILVLVSKRNKLDFLRLLAPQILEAIDSPVPGTIREITLIDG